jgi:hypothetical protein
MSPTSINQSYTSSARNLKSSKKPTTLLSKYSQDGADMTSRSAINDSSQLNYQPQTMSKEFMIVFQKVKRSLEHYQKREQLLIARIRELENN